MEYQEIDCINISSPTVIRKRVTAPNIDCPRSANFGKSLSCRCVIC
uniref:Uncharacterized protein n=1 Tax=Aegilops tauschii subsp. strangulata TaxID=200361 RepID=A0A453PYI6_AEGTS